MFQRYLVSVVEKSAGNSKDEKLTIEFENVVNPVCSTLGLGEIERVLGLFLMNLQETHSKIDRPSDTLLSL